MLAIRMTGVRQFGQERAMLSVIMAIFSVFFYGIGQLERKTTFVVVGRRFYSSQEFQIES